MKHCGTQTLNTNRLLLRRFTLDNAQAVYENWASDPEVTKYLMWPAHTCVSTSRDVLGEWVADYERRDYYQWAIGLKDEGPEPIGCIAVVRKMNLLPWPISVMPSGENGGVAVSPPKRWGR